VEDIKILKQALPYIKEYRDTTFVVKLGGEVIEKPERLDTLAEDISLMYQLNIRIVIIHGGGPQLSDMAKKLGIESQMINGRRVTDDATLELAKMIFSGQISTDILAALRRHGTPAVGMSGVDGNLIQAVRRPKKIEIDQTTGQEKEIDYQNVGDIKSIDIQVLRVLLDNRFVPVIASLAADDEGHVLNINADTIASEISVKLLAEKLFILSNVNGVLLDVNDPTSRFSHLTMEKCESLIRDRVVTKGMLPKLNAAMKTVKGGVPRAYILNGTAENALLREVFTRTGFGTMIVNKEEEASYLQEG
jgi:acetylglutamate kinase